MKSIIKIVLLLLGSFLVQYPMQAQVNVALNKRASQSSMYTSTAGSASNAVDGKTDGRWQSGSVTHTNGQGENNPWWSVDLGEVYEISKIRIWNRTDCCAERLNNFKILVKSQPSGESWRGFVPGTQRNTGSNPLSFEANTQARYVMIQLSNPNGILSLAEVEVYGTKTQTNQPSASNGNKHSSQFVKATQTGSFDCTPGSFFDLIDGGTCWSCPDGYSRTIFPVNGSNACERAASTEYKAAVDRGKGSGLIGTDCPSGAFWDPNGRCYTCPSGYSRTAFAVTSSKACARTVGAAVSKATLIKRVACETGSFFDPIHGGTCWSCPTGYNRTVFPVNGSKACEIDPAAKPILGEVSQLQEQLRPYIELVTAHLSGLQANGMNNQQLFTLQQNHGTNGSEVIHALALDELFKRFEAMQQGEAQGSPQPMKFKAFSLGDMGIDGALKIGANAQFGRIMDIDKPLGPGRPYAIEGYTFPSSVNLTFNAMSLGFAWTPILGWWVDTPENFQKYTATHSITLGATVYLGVVATLYFENYQDGGPTRFMGFTVSIPHGVGVEAEYGRSQVRILDRHPFGH